MRAFNLCHVLAETKLVRNLYCQDVADILLEVYNVEDPNASSCYLNLEQGIL